MPGISGGGQNAEFQHDIQRRQDQTDIGKLINVPHISWQPHIQKIIILEWAQEIVLLRLHTLPMPPRGRGLVVKCQLFSLGLCQHDSNCVNITELNEQESYIYQRTFPQTEK